MTLYEELKKYFEQFFSGPNSSIYHYTEVGIGNEIIKSGHFKLTPHRELNKKSDNGELIIGPSLARDYLRKTSLAIWEKKFNQVIDRDITLHVGSFCEEGNYIHAIKKYGADCLEFKTEYLNKLQSQQSVLIGRVNYNKQQQNEIISTMFDLHEKHTEEDQTTRRVHLFLWLFITFPLLKEEKHHLDNECRIITVHDSNMQGNQIGKIPDKIKFDPNDILSKH